MSKDRLSRFIFFLVIIDILVLPYFPLFAINSLFFLMFFDVFNQRIYTEKSYLTAASLFLFFAAFSTILSYFIQPLFFSENIKRFAQFVLIFASYFYIFSFFVRNDSKNMVGIINNIFFAFVFIWALIYFVDLNSFLNYKAYFNKNDSFIGFLKEEKNDIYRFSYIWTDPNNIAYAILGIFLFSIYNLKVGILKSYLYLSVVFFVCLTSMSTAAWLILILIVLPLFFINLNFKRLKDIVTFLFFLLLILVLCWKLLPDLINSDIAVSAIDRFESNNLDSESGISRLGIWENVYNFHQDNLYKYFFMGNGYQLYNNNAPIAPHNGILLILFGYGLPATICFLYFFFRFKINKSYLFLIPFFLCFFINIMIGETKLFLLYVYLLAYVRAQENRGIAK